MGLTKRRLIEEELRGWHSQGDGHVCVDCLTDDYLKGQAEEVKSPTCTYCGSPNVDGRLLMLPIDELVEMVAGAIHYLYNDPAEELPYETAEGGYQGTVYDTYDVLCHLDFAQNEDLLDDLCRSIDHDFWCQRNYFSLSEREKLFRSWSQFKEITKHKLRYLFLVPEADESEFDDEYLLPAGTLEVIGAAITNNNLFYVVEKGQIVFRARTHNSGVEYNCAADLGPPSPEKAKASNRMTPAGIPLFYGSLDRRTAEQEATASSREKTQVTSAAFVAKRRLQLVDLACELSLPSVFDEEWRDLIPKAQFMRSFAKEVAEPIVKDGREHIDYVPTQIVAEYFRNVFRMYDGSRVDGILYRSAVNSAEKCCALFMSAENCADETEEETDQILLTLRSDLIETREV